MSIQRVEDDSFKSAHPISVSPQLLAHILRGTQSLPEDVTTAIHVFSDDEIRFLSPLISKALSQATENQLVAFRILRGQSSDEKAIGGTVHIHGRLLHLALTSYHAGADRKSSSEGQDYASRHSGELAPAQLAFIPEIDQRSSSNEQRNVVAPPPLGTLVIDYQMFGDELDLASPTAQSLPNYLGSLPCNQTHIPPALGMNGGTALHETPFAADDKTQALKELVCEQAIELDALKEDMRALRHTLSEIEAKKHKSTKPKFPPPLQRPILNGIGSFSQAVDGSPLHHLRLVLC